jgi:hypothetical protein
MSKSYRDSITPQQAEARRQALVQLLRAAGQAVDAGGSRESLERLNTALIGMGVVRDGCWTPRNGRQAATGMSLSAMASSC